MLDELKLCPWCNGEGAIYAAGEPYFNMVECQVCHKCVVGDSGSIEDAVIAWNALPRAPRWTEYDGTEATLPAGGRVLVQLFNPAHYKAPGRFYDFWLVGAYGLKYWHDADEEVQIGDRWMPWPEGAE